MKRKRILSAMLSLSTAACLLFGMTACDNTSDAEKEENPSVSDISDTGIDERLAEMLLFTEISDEEGIVIGYSIRVQMTQGETELCIPSTYNRLPVIAIEEFGFSSCNNFRSIKIPDSVTSIGEGAFWSCWSLTSIEIPDGVTSIERSTFQQCYDLISVRIPDGVTSIGNYAFNDCTSLTSIEIPDGVTAIGADAFSQCRELTSIKIPDGVTSIEEGTFASCFSLTSIEIPDTVTTIGNGAFFACKSLQEINYKGTKEQWGEIEKYVDAWSSWSESMPRPYTVKCSDGDIVVD